MANSVFQQKRTSVSGRAANSTTLPNPGQIAINMADGIMYSTNGTFVFEIGSNNTNTRVTGNATIKGIIANGTIGTAGQVLSSNGTVIYWTTPTGGAADQSAAYTWTNLHLFNANATVNATFNVTNSTANVALFAANGFVGIGTNAPSDKFQVYGTTSIDFSARVDSSTAGDRPSFRFIHTGGSLTTQTPSASRLGLVSFAGVNDSSAFSTFAYFDSFLEGAANSTVNSYIKFATSKFGTLSETFRISGDRLVVVSGVGVQANGTLGTAGQVLTSNGSSVFWSTAAAGSVDQAAQYAWTNTHTFAANVIIGNSAPLTSKLNVYSAWDAAVAGQYPAIITSGGYGGGIGFVDGSLTTGMYAQDSGTKLVIFVGQSASNSASSRTQVTISNTGTVVMNNLQANSILIDGSPAVYSSTLGMMRLGRFF